jgi:hypothetical protein
MTTNDKIDQSIPAAEIGTQKFKSEWIQPSIAILVLNTAAGAHPGPFCDKFGSLSHGSGCP